MSINEEHKSVRPRPAAFNGVDAVLDAQALHNLAGFFDVLIQMDLAKQRNEKENYEKKELQKAKKQTKQTHD